ncbi:hypothetical protein TNCV_495061 [Trichonephila clavipes]|nr:hypothetical protein TNCV_495061 [Trichonephila clavipes]
MKMPSFKVVSDYGRGFMDGQTFSGNGTSNFLKCCSPPSGVGVVRQSFQNALVVHRSIATDLMSTLDLRHIMNSSLSVIENPTFRMADAIRNAGWRDETSDGKVGGESKEDRLRKVVKARSRSAQRNLLHLRRAKNGLFCGAELCNQVLWESGFIFKRKAYQDIMTSQRDLVALMHAACTSVDTTLLRYVPSSIP